MHVFDEGPTSKTHSLVDTELLEWASWFSTTALLRLLGPSRQRQQRSAHDFKLNGDDIGVRSECKVISEGVYLPKSK